VLRKSSPTQKYSARLKLQALKQRSFIPTHCILSPNISDEGYSGDNYWFEMDYIHGYDFISFVERAGPRELEHFWEVLRAFLLREISQSEVVPYPRAAFITKVDQVSSMITTRHKTIERAISYIRDFDSSSPFLSGTCHGDLTFSNMVISKDVSKIYFIDFLDNFYDTPIQDIVKIRQDTLHGWTLRKYTRQFDFVKTDIVFKFLDRKLISFIRESSILTEFYKPMQLLSLLRILVYTTDTDTYNYLIKCLEYELANEFDITNSG